MKRRIVIVILAALALRVAYVAVQPRFDPTFGRPILDGAYYVAAAKAILGGAPPSGVYYMPPLYAWVLSLFFRLFGGMWTLLFLVQQATVVAAAVILGWVASRIAGEWAGLWTTVLALLYHPVLFFASRPVGESLALLLLSVALAGAVAAETGAGALSGASAGLLSLVRPNFLPLAPVWSGIDGVRRRVRRAAACLLAFAVVLVPSVWHNFAASGHLVPVSANGGVVFWLGNAPGAVGVYTPVPGFSGALDTQQQEAIAEASARSGRTLDAVESDGFWWREGLRARAASGGGTLTLLARRVLLCIDNAEHGLDYAPALDESPLRFATPLPFAVLFGLAVFGVSSLGFARTGGIPVWSSIAIAAAAPLAFYVSSRHRLPTAFLLTIPAGAGLTALRAPRRLPAALAGITACALSLSIPSSAVMREEKASALSALADVERKAGDMESAARSARHATELDPGNAQAWFNRGAIEAARGDLAAAEAAYRSSLSADPTQPDAAGNLAGLLVRSGRAAEAPALLEKAVAAWPRHTVAWTNLVVAYAASGDRTRARDAAHRAAASGVSLDPGLVATVEGPPKP